MVYKEYSLCFKQKPTPPSTSTKDANVWVNRSLKQLLDMGFKVGIDGFFENPLLTKVGA